ncbi:hypothetical protein A3A69_02545 [candidate division WWE3 bacterium RIFCSPLOWO2_01_FULL_37_15]|uniref:Uncharacterized protein n=1 Tax=candidate division WWE3 bacterium RIFCSPLOWO2_01_FULL_37_15 TaxID=1802622 RepID=A0A1F4UUA8_UNCKA|nr:MAG: hypothetical protein A3A69_02545 [candidate division WWE3 bacterium RIFCSPLOWO2_01_FULL_37_15]
MMKTRIAVVFTLAFAALGTLALAVPASAGAKTPASCLWKTAVEGSSTVFQTWPITETADPCLGVNVEVTGTLVIEGGWVFTAPLKINGVTVTTTFVQGEAAPQIVGPLTYTLEAGSGIVVEPSKMTECCNEVGVRVTFTPTPPTSDCKIGSFSKTAEELTAVTSWAEGEIGCIRFTANSSGTLAVQGGWVFTAPLTLNGHTLSTTFVSDEIAPQVVPFNRTIVAGQVMTFTVSGSGARELGLRYTLTAPIYKVYLVLVRKDPTPLIETRTVNPQSNQLQVVKASWPAAEPNQLTCLQVNFTGGAPAAVVESGWFFGTLTSSTLNGNAIVMPVTDPPDEAAMAIGQIRLNAPQALRICTQNVNIGAETGLRIRYPSP